MKSALLIAFALYMLALLSVFGNFMQGSSDNTTEYERLMRYYR